MLLSSIFLKESRERKESDAKRCELELFVERISIAIQPYNVVKSEFERIFNFMG